MADNKIKVDLGGVDAYALAQQGGYTGSREQFAADLAQQGELAAQVREDRTVSEVAAGNADKSAKAAAQSETNAQESAETADRIAVEAQKYAGNAQTAASESAQSAVSAKLQADESTKSAQNAQDAAQAAAQSVAEIEQFDARISANAAAIDALYVNQHLDGNKQTYDRIMRQWFIANGALTATPEQLTVLCERWYKITADEWHGYSEFYKFNTSNTSEGWKGEDNAGLTCVPSTNAVANTDDYAGLPLFACVDVNYTIDSDTLEPVIHAIKGITDWFTSAPTDSFVGVMQMTGWVRRTSTETNKKVEYRATEAEGFEPLPEGVKVDGNARSFVVHAKYAAGYNAAGKLSSVSGVQPATLRSGSTGSTSISHNGQIAKWREWGAQYCGSSLCDIAFVQLMLEIKYAVLGSAQVMAGCRDYYASYRAAVAENGVTRVLLTAANSAYFVVGSCVSIGTSTDRSNATCYNIHDIATISSIEDVTVGDVAYKAVNLETERTFDTTTETCITPQPWRTGSTDDVQGNDGSPYSNTSGKEPMKIQGIELMLGMYEVPGDTTLYEDTEKYTVYANRKAADIKAEGSGTNPVIVGTIPKEEAAAWKYNAELNWDANDQEGYMLAQQFADSSTTGYRSATYRDGASATGWREWLAFGHLSYGGDGGFACAALSLGLGLAHWHIGARMCGSGGNRGEYMVE